jgi:catechol 2,3-dioxygenase-like lactoylglutathione lyase family enzyme
MEVVHRRCDETPVAWLGWGEDPPVFVIVLLEGDYEQNAQPAWQHIGLSVDSREEVDAVYQRAEADGIAELWPPAYAGPIVGYFCGVRDPDGNMVEFSHGQRIG